MTLFMQERQSPASSGQHPRRAPAPAAHISHIPTTLGRGVPWDHPVSHESRGPDAATPHRTPRLRFPISVRGGRPGRRGDVTGSNRAWFRFRERAGSRTAGLFSTGVSLVLYPARAFQLSLLPGRFPTFIDPGKASFSFTFSRPFLDALCLFPCVCSSAHSWARYVRTYVRTYLFILRALGEALSGCGGGNGTRQWREKWKTEEENKGKKGNRETDRRIPAPILRPRSRIRQNKHAPPPADNEARNAFSANSGGRAILGMYIVWCTKCRAQTNNTLEWRQAHIRVSTTSPVPWSPSPRFFNPGVYFQDKELVSRARIPTPA